MSVNGQAAPEKKKEQETIPSVKPSSPVQDIHGPDLPKNQTQFRLNAHGTSYQVIRYSDDYRALELRGADGKMFKAKNVEGLKLEPKKSLDLNPIQKELLSKGKSLMITSGTDIPYKISMNQGKGENLYDITTVSMAQFKNTNQVKATAVKSVKQKL